MVCFVTRPRLQGVKGGELVFRKIQTIMACYILKLKSSFIPTDFPVELIQPWEDALTSLQRHLSKGQRGVAWDIEGTALTFAHPVTSVGR